MQRNEKELTRHGRDKEQRTKNKERTDNECPKNAHRMHKECIKNEQRMNKERTKKPASRRSPPLHITLRECLFAFPGRIERVKLDPKLKPKVKAAVTPQ